MTLMKPLGWCKNLKPEPGFGFIYSLCDPRNPAVPKYIGRTTQLNRRIVLHKYLAKKRPQHHVSRWINSILLAGVNPIANVIETVPLSEIVQREEEWIKFFKPLGVLANRSDGPGTKGMLLGPPSVENRLKTIARNKLGCSEKTRAILRAQRIGKPLSEEAKRKWRAHPSFEIVKAKFKLANDSRKKPVICVDSGNIYDSICEAARNMGCSQPTMKNAVNKGWRVKGLKFQRHFHHVKPD